MEVIKHRRVERACEQEIKKKGPLEMNEREA